MSKERGYKTENNTPEEEGVESIIDGLGRKWRLAEVDYSEMGVGSMDFVGDWRKSMAEHVVTEDVRGMQRKAAPLSQLRMTELALESTDERIALEANKFILAQSGYGAINKVEHQVQYDGMPTDQLVAMLNSSMARIGKHSPELLEKMKSKLGGLIGGVVNGGEEIDAEYEVSGTSKVSDGGTIDE